MFKCVHKNVLRILLALGGLMYMAGCEITTTPALPVDVSTSSSDLASFIQQFAREALAAFLF